jgi:hypothetical protein
MPASNMKNKPNNINTLEQPYFSQRSPLGCKKPQQNAHKNGYIK